MKKLFISTLAFAAIVISCEKAAVDNEPSLNTTTITAEIVNEEEDNAEPVLKSDYTITNPASDTKAYFHWSGAESIGVMSYTSSLYPTVFNSTSSATTETSLVFEGTEDVNEIGYAFYPSKEATYGNAKIDWWDSGSYHLYLNPELTYNASYPLKNIVPMIGKLIDGKYEFVPITGIIAVRVKNLPSEARAITLSSSGSALSGYYLLTSSPNRTSVISNTDWVRNNGVTISIAANGGNKGGVKTLTFSSGLDREEHYFYFPVSVGTLASGLVITIKDGLNNELQTITYSKPITTQKGKITRLPLMDLAKATKVAVSGDATEFYAYLTALGPEAAKVKVAVASTSAAALTAASTSTKIITETGEENKIEVSNGLSTSGKYYLAYKVYTSSDEELYSNTKAVYFVNSTDASAIEGTFSRGVTAGEVLSGYESNAPTTTSFKFIVSTDPTRGNIMMTAMDTYDPFTSNIPGVFKPDSDPSHALWLRFYNADLMKGFTSGKYLLNGSSPTSNDLIFVFTNEKNSFYVGAGQYGIATTNSYPPTWYYVYNGNKETYSYEKQ